MDQDALNQLNLPRQGNTVFWLRDQAREIYNALSRAKSTLTHDNQVVYVHENRFDHAFMRDSRAGGGAKDEFDEERLVRVRWFAPLVGGMIDGTECYEITQSGRTKRLYICDAERYVCWLEPGKTPGEWKFSTAYVALTHQLRKFRQSGARIWRNNKKRAP